MYVFLFCLPSVYCRKFSTFPLPMPAFPMPLHAKKLQYAPSFLYGVIYIWWNIKYIQVDVIDEYQQESNLLLPSFLPITLSNEKTEAWLVSNGRREFEFKFLAPIFSRTLSKGRIYTKKTWTNESTKEIQYLNFPSKIWIS